MDHAFQNANILATLPARLGQHGKGTTFLHVCVGEEMANIEGCTAMLRVLISDATAPTDGDMDEGADRSADRIERGLIRRNPYVLGDGLYTTPLTRQTAGDLEVRINNIRLVRGGTQEGWLVYPVEPVQLASGPNLLTFRLSDESAEISIEKIELDLEH